MGFLTGTDKTTTTSDPWKPQGDALKSIFNTAGANFAARQNTPWYQGPLHAGIDPTTGLAIQGTQDFTNGMGQSLVGGQAGAAFGGLGQSDAFHSGISDLMHRSQTDATGSNIESAGAYANNPYLDGQIDAASRDVTRNLNEQELPSIDRHATGTGNINSTRAGVASGIAQRGAADRIGDISATMRGDAYNKGLNLAENSRSTNLGAETGAAGLYGTAVGQGISAGNSASTNALQNLDAEAKAGQIRQTDQQGLYDANLAAWQQKDQRSTNLLKDYYGIVGANNWGGTKVENKESTPSILGAILGTITTIAGAAKSIGFKVAGGGGG